MRAELLRVTLSEVPDNAEPDTEYIFPEEINERFTLERTDRNKGWLTPSMIRHIRTRKIGVAGAGGIGGHVEDSLNRLAPEELRVADSGFFDISNIHRQFAAKLGTVDKSKMLETIRMLRETARDVRIKGYSGINRLTVETFLNGLDVVDDAIEFHAIGARCLLNIEAHRMGVPVFNGNSVGFGTNVLLFHPDGQSLMDAFPFDLEYAYHLEDRFARGTVTQEEYDFICHAINSVFLSEIPNYGGPKYDTTEAFLKRLFVDRTASIVSTNPKMAAGVLCDRMLIQLVESLGIYDNICHMPVFPEFLYFDAAQWKAEVRSLNLKKIRHELSLRMPRT